jgi:Chromate transporter
VCKANINIEDTELSFQAPRDDCLLALMEVLCAPACLEAPEASLGRLNCAADWHEQKQALAHKARSSLQGVVSSAEVELRSNMSNESDPDAEADADLESEPLLGRYQVLVQKEAQSFELDAKPSALTLAQQLWDVTKEYTPLTLTTFGGPAAHTAVLHDRFVVQKRWMSEHLFVELFAIESALPGPGSVQLAYSIALMRHGIIPAIWSFIVWR